MDEFLDTMGARRLAQVKGTPHVGIDVAIGRGIRIRDRDERGEMENEFHSPHEFEAKVRVPDIAGFNLNVPPAVHLIQPPPGIEGIVLDQGSDTGRLPRQVFDQVRPDEPVSPCNENTLAR